jgi:Glu-tRNA(Gln) amidotransferase subunit E-like FAD-binding protein
MRSTIFPLVMLIFVAAEALAQPSVVSRRTGWSAENDPDIRRADELLMRFNAIRSEWDALQDSAERDAKGMMAALPSVKSLEEYNAAATRFPLSNFDASVKNAASDKWIALFEEALDPLPVGSDEHVDTLRSITREKSKVSSAQAEAMQRFIEQQDDIKMRRQTLESQWDALMRKWDAERERAMQQQALANQQAIVNELRSLRDEVRKANEDFTKEVRDAEWRLRNWR